MKKAWDTVWFTAKVLFGCCLFGLTFNWFLLPHDMNIGGVSGLGMAFLEFAGIRSIGVGTLSVVLNLPIFAVGAWKLGKRFMIASVLGMLASSLAIDLFAWVSVPDIDPLMAALYGGVGTGLGIGIIFAAGASTGGSDIICRLLKRRFQYLQIGVITTCFDAVVAVLTGLAFRDARNALYSGVAIFVTGRVIDAVVYSFDYSKVVLVISKEYERVAKVVGKELSRGCTFLEGQGAYSGKKTKVVLTAVKKHQIADLKALIVDIDPNAFIIVQEAHQVLGDGFARYSKDAL